MKVVLRRLRGRVTYSLDMLSHARGVQIQWWEKCLSLTRPPTPGAVAAGGQVRPAVTAVKREESLFHHSTFRKTPRRVPPGKGDQPLNARARMRGTSQTEDDRARRTERDENARAIRRTATGAVASAPARIDAEEFNDVHVSFVSEKIYLLIQ